MRKINEKPFELVGFSYVDYKDWCEINKKKEKDVKSKKEFFEKIRHYEILKKDGKVIDVSKEKE